jgi:hypothetical protein
MTYQPQAIDTSAENDRFFFQAIQKRSPGQRLQMAAVMMQNARRLSLCSLHQIFSDIEPETFAQKVALAWLQEDCPPHFRPVLNEMAWIQDSIGLAGLLQGILSARKIPYYITGGVAAIAYGEPRTTRDLNLVLALDRSDLPPLVTLLENAGFYVPGVADVQNGQLNTLGITHQESISRADLILAEFSAETDQTRLTFDRLKFQRIRVLDFPGVGLLPFASPEDLILSKLLWGQQSQSEKQWRDVLGILKVQGTQLEWDYLRSWADSLKLTELLDRALTATGIMGR